MKRILAAAVLAGLIAACTNPGPGYVHPEYGPAVRIDVAHVHTDGCGHFHHDGYWYHVRDHRHGPGCGHIVRDGTWVMGEPSVF